MKRALAVLAIICGALAAFAALSFFTLSLSGRSNPLQVFPQRSMSTLRLPDASQGIHSRVEKRSADGKRVLEAVSELKVDGIDGITKFEYFRDTDGSKRREEQFYPVKGTAPRQLKSHFNVAEDGSTVNADASFRQDGTLVRQGERQPDGSYVIVWYHADGKSVARRQMIDAKNKALGEVAFRADGSKELESVLVTEGSTQVMRTTTFSTANLRQSVAIKWPCCREEVTTFRSDGDTIETRMVMQTYSTNVEYFDANKELTHTRAFTHEGMTVVFFREGKPWFKQYWTRFGEVKEPKFKLSKVEEVDEKDNVIRTFMLDEGRLTKIMVPDEAGRIYGSQTQYLIRADGTVSGVEKRPTMWADPIARRELTASDGRQVQYPEKFLKEVPFKLPPNPVPEPEPQGP